MEVTFNMEETNSGVVHDCDLYLQVSTFPTTRHYFLKETGVGKDATLKVNSTAPRGVWYVGVFGFLGCTYVLDMSSPSLPCPNGCNKQGTCSSGVCSCAPNWGGLDCSLANRTLTLATPVSTTVAQQNWSFFYYDVAAPMEKLVFTMDSDKDCDLYLRRETPPDLFNFDAVNASLPAPGQRDVSTLTLENPAQKRWYAGVYGFQACSFSMRVDQQQVGGTNCLNNCSAHGMCRSGVCHCSATFSDEKCANMTAPLPFTGVTPGYVDAGEWNWFYLELQTTNDIHILVHQTNAGADCDSYLRRGERPDRTHFDSADLSAGDANMTIASPAKATYYLGVFGWKACAFEITVSEVEISSDCGAHGSANPSADGCICNEGYFGPTCNVQPTAIASGQTLNDTVTPGAWKYYFLNGSATSYLFTVQETGANPVGGRVSVYTQARELPDQQNYSSRDQALRVMHYTKDVFVGAQSQRVLIVGIFGSTTLPDATQIPFLVSAFTF